MEKKTLLGSVILKTITTTSHRETFHCREKCSKASVSAVWWKNN